MGSAIKTYTLAELQPIGDALSWDKVAYRLQSNLSIAMGEALAAVTAASQNEKQTIYINTGSAGTFKIGFLGQFTSALAYNVSAADMQTALRALSTIGAGNVDVTLNSTTYTLEFKGSMANLPQPLVVLDTSALTATGTLVSETQIGRTQYALAPYSSSVVTNPADAPNVSDTGTGSWGAGDHEFVITYVTAAGESLPSPSKILDSAGSKKFRVAAITVPAGLEITAVNLYIDGQFAKQLAVAAGVTTQTDLDVSDITTAGYPPPRTSTAYVLSDGTQALIGFAQFQVTTDQYGNITQGANVGGDDQGSYLSSLPVYTRGRFNAADLTGLDAAALVGRGMVEQGSISTGLVRLF